MRPENSREPLEFRLLTVCRERDAMAAENAELRALLADERCQFGSCDGCGQHLECNFCHGDNNLGDRAEWYEGHTADCPLAKALSAAKAER